MRDLGRAHAAAADDLAAIAASLSALPAAVAAEVFGPIGAGFLAALADAATNTSEAVARLGERVAWTVAAAHASANAYEDAEHRSAHLLAVGL